MKCPKCGYQSFNHLTACRKCGRNLADQQEKLGLDLPGIQDTTTPPRQSEAESLQNGIARNNPAPDESLQDFFESLEETPENDLSTAEEDPFAEPPGPPLDDLDPEDSPFGTFDEAFSLEDTDDDELIFSFNEMEDDKEKFGDETFVLNDVPAERGKKDPKPSLEDIPEQTSQTSTQEGSQETDFFSFADLDAELDAVGGPVEDLPLGIKPEPEGRQTKEPFSNGFVSQQEIEQAMAEDAVLKGRTELEQGELPIAGNGVRQEVFLREEEEVPRSVLGMRLLAILTDLGILSGIFAVFVLAGEMVRLPGRTDWFRFSSDYLLDLAAPYFLVLFTLCFGYFTLFHFLTGQTPGKMLWRLRVEGETGTPLSLAQAFLRTAGGLLALLPAGLGFLSIVLNRQRRGWNDRLANSRVVPAISERN